ncbi:hypothetical protein llap_18259 [Limosa lapponica baueri]|uniref:Uncharacterized protein n=1 Tax=Limosa lapponica baueri TaxID=1758121 RepID=A0A2I0TCC1_LIMLA|nr:hypothetical protein llap_18259 [Limosa lapponica baueri]
MDAEELWQGRMFLELEFFLDVSPEFFGTGPSFTERFMNPRGLGPDFLCRSFAQFYWDRPVHSIAVTIPGEILALQSSALLYLSIIAAALDTPDIDVIIRDCVLGKDLE